MSYFLSESTTIFALDKGLQLDGETNVSQNL